MQGRDRLRAEAERIPSATPERKLDLTGAHCVLGFEVNESAAELLRITDWIGELHWRLREVDGLAARGTNAPSLHSDTHRRSR